jgi:hypothetical protein
LTIVVLLFLAGIWGVVLYGWFRDRLADTRPADSIGSFRHQLSVLERTGPTTSLSAPRRTVAPSFAPSSFAPSSFAPSAARVRPAARVGSSAAKRRRDILFGLLAVMGGSLLLSFVPGLGALRLLHLAADALCVAYLALLIRQRNIRAEREMKLRFLPSPAGAGGGVGDSALLLRRTGN